MFARNIARFPSSDSGWAKMIRPKQEQHQNAEGGDDNDQSFDGFLRHYARMLE
jgi:hypothetical protein